MGEEDTKELLQVVPEELINELLELEGEMQSYRRGKRKGNCRRKKTTSKKMDSRDLAGAFADFNKLLKKI